MIALTLLRLLPFRSDILLSIAVEEVVNDLTCGTATGKLVRCDEGRQSVGVRAQAAV